MTHPGLSRGDVLQSSHSSLAPGTVAVAALEDQLIQPHHLGVPKPLSPLRLARHFG